MPSEQNFAKSIAQLALKRARLLLLRTAPLDPNYCGGLVIGTIAMARYHMRPDIKKCGDIAFAFNGEHKGYLNSLSHTYTHYAVHIVRDHGLDSSIGLKHTHTKTSARQLHSSYSQQL